MSAFYDSPCEPPCEPSMEGSEDMRKYTLEELEALPTLCVGQADDLKVESHILRVWLSRCGVEDGEPYPNKVTIEQVVDSGTWGVETPQWKVVAEYQAL